MSQTSFYNVTNGLPLSFTGWAIPYCIGTNSQLKGVSSRVPNLPEMNTFTFNPYASISLTKQWSIPSHVDPTGAEHGTIGVTD